MAKMQRLLNENKSKRLKENFQIKNIVTIIYTTKLQKYFEGTKFRHGKTAQLYCWKEWEALYSVQVLLHILKLLKAWSFASGK